MANILYIKSAITGNTVNSMDGINGSLLEDGDVCLVMAANVFYPYKLDVDSGAAESSPGVISPDNNAGNKRWILQVPYYAT